MRCGACGASKGFFLCHHLLSVNCNGPCHGKPHMRSWTGGRSYVGISCSGLCDIAALHQDLSVVSSEALIWNHHRAVSPFFGVLAVGPEPDVVDNSAARAHNLCRWHSYHSVAKLGITWRTDVHNTCLHAVAALPLVALDRAWQYGLQRFSNGICAGWQIFKEVGDLVQVYRLAPLRRQVDGGSAQCDCWSLINCNHHGSTALHAVHTTHDRAGARPAPGPGPPQLAANSMQTCPLSTTGSSGSWRRSISTTSRKKT